MRSGAILLFTAVAAFGQIKVNYFEGEAFLNGQTLTQTEGAPVTAGNTLAAGSGRMEISIAPDVYLRLGNQSSVRIVSDDPAGVTVELLTGSAVFDSVRAAPQAIAVTLRVRDASVQIHTPGEYQLDANPPQIRIHRGEAQVSVNGQTTAVRSSQGAFALGAGAPPGQAATEPDTLLDIWSTNRRILLSSLLANPHPGGSPQPQPPMTGPDDSNVVDGTSSWFLGMYSLTGIPNLMYMPIRPYRPGSQFFGPGAGYLFPYYYSFPAPLRVPGAAPFRPARPVPPVGIGPGIRPGVPGFGGGGGGVRLPGPVIGH